MKQWKKINFANGRYEISDKGEVLDTKRNAILHQYITKGFARVYLYDLENKTGKSPYVHILVADTFLSKPSEKEIKSKNLVVTHLDNDKSNNSYTNLAWMPAKEAMAKYGFNHHHNGNEKKILMFKDGEMQDVFFSIMDAVRWLNANGYSPAYHAHVSNTLRGKKGHYKGFAFKYAEEDE